MAQGFCTNCGANLGMHETECRRCGTPVSGDNSSGVVHGGNHGGPALGMAPGGAPGAPGGAPKPPTAR